MDTNQDLAATVNNSAKSLPVVEDRTIQKTLTLSAIVGIIFFTVSGGPFGLEDTIGGAGPGLGLMLILLTPLIWGLPVALMSAELGTAIPAQGGYYVWVKKALGPLGGFTVGSWAWMATWFDMALYPVLFVSYLSFFFPIFGETGDPLIRKSLMVLMIWILALWNMRGSKSVGGSTQILGIILLIPFIAIILIAVWTLVTEGAPHNPFQPFIPEGASFSAALTGGLLVVMWNYMGWEGTSTVAGEMKNPRRDYPLSLAIALPLIVAVYFIPTFCALMLVGTDGIEWTAGAWAIIAGKVGGVWLGYAMGFAGLVSAVGLFMGRLLVGSRIPFVMGRDGFLPRFIQKQNLHGAPWVSLAICASIYSVIAVVFDDFALLASFVVFFYGGVLTLEFAALFILRIKQPNLERPFKIPGGWPVLILLLILPLSVLTIAIYSQISEAESLNSIMVAIVLMVSVPLLYPVAAWWKRKNNIPDDDALDN